MGEKVFIGSICKELSPLKELLQIFVFYEEKEKIS